MAQRDENLVAQIEQDALDDKAPLATALRKCIVLGGKSGSEELRDWATRELQGYPGIEDLPNYRVLVAPLRLDGLSGNYQITGEELPPTALPDFAREHISNEVKLTDGVGTLEDLARQPQIKLAPAGASDIARYINAQSGDPFRHINSIYWAVSPSAMRGVLDQIRTALTQLVAELRANMGGNEGIPSAEAANHAVHVVVTGEQSQVNVTTAQTSGAEAPATATTSEPVQQQGEGSGFWTRSRKIGAFVVGCATVAGAVFGLVQLLG